MSLNDCFLADFEGKKDEEVPIDWETGQDAEATSTGGNYGSTSGGTPLQVNPALAVLTFTGAAAKRDVKRSVT